MKTNHKKDNLARLFSLSLVILLSLPALGYLFHFSAGKKLDGYVETQTTRPAAKLAAWFDKKLQPYLEEKINTNIGFKPLCIRLFNELTFRLFAEQGRTDLLLTKQHGLCFKSSILHLYNEYLKRDQLLPLYGELAKKLSDIQRLLAAKGKHFLVVISASKPYVHLEGLGERFLPINDPNLYDKTASLGNELKKQGVNVIDSGPILREFYQKKAIETHPFSGVHWNYYAGCIIAKHLYNNLRKTFADTPKLLCGAPKYKEPGGVDRDGWEILNVFTKANLFKPSPLPTPSATFYNNYLPKILIIGDSFSNQIVSAFYQTKSYSEITVSSYFRTNTKYKLGSYPIDLSPPHDEKIEQEILAVAMDSDVVILQMVDYNIPRMGYGFVEPFLKRLMETGSKEQA